jgi:2-keto-3-deoxy-L-rhamnonate aldolase RhmA
MESHVAEFRKNPLKRRIESGGVGVIANGPNSSDICDFLGQFGFDATFVDFEHGGVSWSELSDISRASDLWDMATVVRVNTLAESLILRALDQGASAVMIPHVISPSDAEQAARACRYPPSGVRGVAGSRRAYGVQNYFEPANAEVQCMALIEDAAALDNLDELVRVDGIDCYYVAPSDLAASMGHTGNPGHAAVQDAINRAIDRIVAAERVAGTLVNDSNVAGFLDRGVRCVGVSWPAWVGTGASKFLEGVRNRS